MEVGYQTFVDRLDALKRLAKNGAEFWTGRAIQDVLGYTEWRNVEEVIQKAKVACDSGGVQSEKHFVEATDLVEIGNSAQRARADWILSRYACYLIAMNADSTKQEVGYAQAYFAIQARRQEVQDQLTATERRLLLRNRVKEANKSLASAAKKAGVQRYPVFQDAGYKGLYGGLGQADVKASKGIPANQNLLDCIDRAELAANEFRITQTEQKLVREGVNTEVHAIRTHGDVGREVREAIRKIGGTMPERLPAVPPINKVLAAERKEKRLAERKKLKE
jgi:DNA-damage-inducible protein D